jgi:hypothetical protein
MSQANTNGAAIKIEPSADGTDFPFSGGTYQFKPGKPYLLKVSTTGAAVDYRIRIEIICEGACM